MSELSNAAPETGPFVQRDRLWHPPALTARYKTSVLRSPQRAPISFGNTMSEMTGPVFGRNILGEHDNDLISNFSYATDPDNGDQFEQVDDRNVYGANVAYKHTYDWAGREQEFATGVQIRRDDIGKVALYRTILERKRSC